MSINSNLGQLSHWNMILSDKRILEEIDKGHIIIEPFKRDCLGTNSYDVHLGKHLATYRSRVLDAKVHGGFGIMVDDLIAGLFAAAVLTLLTLFVVPS